MSNCIRIVNHAFQCVRCLTSTTNQPRQLRQPRQQTMLCFASLRFRDKQKKKKNKERNQIRNSKIVRFGIVSRSGTLTLHAYSAQADEQISISRYGAHSLYPPCHSSNFIICMQMISNMLAGFSRIIISRFSFYVCVPEIWCHRRYRMKHNNNNSSSSLSSASSSWASHDGATAS